MHPALSVIVFTVLSGAGYGLFSVLVLLALSGVVAVERTPALVSIAVSLVLVTIGLISSTFHLANPKNAWRAMSRFRTSWLSREGLFAIVFYPLALGFGWFVFALSPGSSLADLSVIGKALGVASALMALVTVFSTGMIYACLKTIRQWNTALTPANYVLLGLMSGSLLLASILAMFPGDRRGLLVVAAVLIVVGALAKAIYYYWVRNVTGPSINTATGFNRATVRLLDVGHTAGTFLTDEFGYFVERNRLALMKLSVFVFAFIAPLTLIVSQLLLGEVSVALVWTVVLIALLGLGLERWLFFAEARHVVNLYHGQQRT